METGKRSLFGSMFSNKGLSLSQKTMIVLAGGGSNLVNNVVHAAFLKFYTDFVGMKPVTFGLIYFIFTMWNVVNDPLLGIILDRIKPHPKRGKYVYIMRVTAPVSVLAMIAMLMANPSWPEWVMFVFMLVGLYIFDTAYNIFTMTYTSFILCVAPTQDERTDFSVLQSYLYMVPAFMSSVIPTVFLTGGYSRRVVILIFIGVAAFGGLLYFLGLRIMKDSPSYYSAAQDSNISALAATRKGIKEALTNKAFMMFMLYSLLVGGAVGAYMNAYIYYMQHVIGAKGFVASLPDLFGGLYQIVVYPVAAYLIRKRGCRNALVIMLIPSVISLIGLYFARAYWQGMLCYIFLMTGFATTYAVRNPLFGAIIDEDEYRTGERKTGLYMGLSAMLTLPARAINISIFTAIIQFFGYNGAAAQQSARTIEGLRIATGLVPALFIVLGLIPLLLFPIDAKKEKELSEFSAKKRRGDGETVTAAIDA